MPISFGMLNFFYLIIFLPLTIYAHTGIDSNCRDVKGIQESITFSNQSALKGTYAERQETVSYLKKHNYPLTEYYQLVEKNPLTGNYDVDKFNPVLDTERQYKWDKIQENYKKVIAEVKTTTQQKNYKDEFYDRNGNFRSMHQCQNNSECIGKKAYCIEQMASKSVVDKMQQYMRVHDGCLKGAKKGQSEEEFIKECDGAVSNLAYLKKKGNEIKKIAETKDAKTQDFFYGVNKEFSEFKNDWDKLKAAIVQKKKDYEEDQKQKLLDAELARQMAINDKKMEPLREEMNKCAALSMERDKDVKDRNLAQGLCYNIGMPSDTLKQFDNIHLTENQVDKLEEQVENVEQKFVEKMAEDITKTAFHDSLMSLWLVEKPMPKTVAEAKTSACKVAPDLCKLKGFDKSIEDAFNKFGEKIKAPGFKSLDLAGRTDALKNDILPAMNKMNKLCADFRKKSGKRVDEVRKERWQSEEEKNKFPVMVQDNTRVDQTQMNLKTEDAFRHMGSNVLMSEMLPLYNGVVSSSLGHLVITDTFKDPETGIGYFSQEKLEQHCVYGDGVLFKNSNPAIKDPVTLKDLQKADGEFRTLVKGELTKLNNEFGTINNLSKDKLAKFMGMDEDSRSAFIEQYLKTNPLTIVKMLQENPTPEFVHALCKYILSIEDEDYRKRVGEYILAGAGAVVGVALACTGIGTPLGLYLLAASAGITMAEVNNIMEDKADHARQSLYIEQAGATGQMEFNQAIRESLSEKKQSEGTVGDVLWVVGPDIAGFGIGKLVKLAKPMMKMERFKSLSKLSKLGGKSSKVIVAGEEGVVELKHASLGLARIEKEFGRKFISESKMFNNLSQEEVLELGSIVQSLDPMDQAKFFTKIKEMKTASEMRAFLKNVHTNLDDLIAGGKLSSDKLSKVVDDVSLKSADPFDDMAKMETKVDDVIEKADDIQPAKLENEVVVNSKTKAQIEIEEANRLKSETYINFIQKSEPKLNRNIINQKMSSTDRLAQMHQNNNPKDMKYLLENGKVKADFAGGEAEIFINPMNRKEALKVWKESRIDDFHNSVKAMKIYEERIAGNQKLNTYLYVSKITEEGPNYIVKEFVENSVELKRVIQEPSVFMAIKKIKKELLTSPDIIDQKILQAISRKPPSANFHWDPNTKKIILIDALGF